MRKDTFNELLASIKEGGEVLYGKKKAIRTFKLDDPDVPEIRQHL